MPAAASNNLAITNNHARSSMPSEPEVIVRKSKQHPHLEPDKLKLTSSSARSCVPAIYT
jgi:hypothetical protein